jgi:hypothetical protein
VQPPLAHDADHVVVDDGQVASQVRGIVPRRVDAALELVGTPTPPDTLRATWVHGTKCFAGMLSNQWAVPDLYPIEAVHQLESTRASDGLGLRICCPSRPGRLLLTREFVGECHLPRVRRVRDARPYGDRLVVLRVQAVRNGGEAADRTR